MTDSANELLAMLEKRNQVTITTGVKTEAKNKVIAETKSPVGKTNTNSKVISMLA